MKSENTCSRDETFSSVSKLLMNAFSTSPTIWFRLKKNDIYRLCVGYDTHNELLYSWSLPGWVHVSLWQVLLKVQMKLWAKGRNPAEGIAFSSKWPKQDKVDWTDKISNDSNLHSWWYFLSPLSLTRKSIMKSISGQTISTINRPWNDILKPHIFMTRQILTHCLFLRV